MLRSKICFPQVIVGIDGGATDRILTNAQIFSQTNSVFWSETQLGIALSENVRIPIPKGTKLSIHHSKSSKLNVFIFISELTSF